MPEVFISYRRDDSSGHAGRIFDCMRQRFGDESVFMDVTDVEPGVDFTQALDTALSSCRVVLAVIGAQWLTSTDPEGRRRLDDPGDHVRLEIVRALARGAHVIPVLVRGALMPREQDLPGDLRPLARRQAHEVTDSRWPFDTDLLIRIVERDLGAPGRDVGPAHSGRPTVPVHGAVGRALNRSWTRIVAPAAVLLMLGAIAAFKWSAVEAPTGGFTPPSSSHPGATAQGGGDPAYPAVAGTLEAHESPPARLPASAEARAGAARYKVLGGLVSHVPRGSQMVRLFVRVTNVSAPYGFVVTHDAFRLIADGQAIPPTEAPSLALPMQSASEGWVVFRASRDTGAVVLQVGDFRQDTAKILLDLRMAGTDVSDTPAPTWRYPVDLAARFEKRVGPLVFHVNGARLEHLGDAVPPQPEKLEVAFTVGIENVGRQHGAVVSGDLFRLLVDGVPLAPTKAPIEALAFQASLDGEVVFVMPGTATNAILQVGNIGAETAKVPIDLSAAH